MEILSHRKTKPLKWKRYIDDNDNDTVQFLREHSEIAFSPAELAKEVGNEVLTHWRGAGPKLECHVSCWSSESVFLFLAIQATAFVVIIGFFIIFICNMPPKSRVAKRLMPHNRTPDKSGRKRTRKGLDAAENQPVKDRSGSSRSSCHHSRSPFRKCCLIVPDSPKAKYMLAWAKKLLEAHNKSKERLQRLESELKSSPRSDKPGRAKSPQPEFKYKRNKVQYELKARVLEKLEEAADTSDEKECNEALDEGKKLLLERNRHIMLAEK